MENQNWIVKPKRSTSPLQEAQTVFTDAGKRSRTAAVTWKDEGGWKHKILPAQEGDSLQTLELLAVVWAFVKWIDAPLNIISDSLYVVGIANRIEDSNLRDIKNERLASLLI
ncbi:POK19 protein, partial [Anseranas semipalmata]|nr:POK19 protein [Anseranas semipalmata]